MPAVMRTKSLESTPACTKRGAQWSMAACTRASTSRRPALDRAAEVEVGHLGVLEHLLCRALEQHAAALHHDPVRRQSQPEADVLLDQQDRPPGLAHAHDALVHLTQGL